MKIEQKIAKDNLKVIIDNEMKFKLEASFLNTVKSLNDQKEQFTPNQLSYIDGLYEKYMAAGGFGSVKVKHDIKKKY